MDIRALPPSPGGWLASCGPSRVRGRGRGSRGLRARRSRRGGNEVLGHKGRFDGPSLARFVEQARWGARKIHLLLKSYGIDVEVRPLLVLWGPGTEARPRYAEEKGTPVLCTARRADWLAHLP